MSQVDILSGAAVFWECLRKDLQDAKSRALVQLMTFEGDTVGQQLGDSIAQCTAVDRRVLIDRYTRFFLSDRFVYSPQFIFDKSLGAELRDTKRMIAAMKSSGVVVRWSNPVGPFFWRLPLRNHKKLILVDDIVYVGGINFSDHNFAWPDLMVRIQDENISAFFAADFDATFRGNPVNSAATFGEIDTHCLNGQNNPTEFRPLLQKIETAQKSIWVVSPYLTFPFTDALAQARRNGTRVRILAPAANNKPIVGRTLLWEAKRSDFEVLAVPGMHHFKCLLIDERELVLGSSNFDFISFLAQEECVVSFRSLEVIAEFLDLVIRPLEQRSTIAVLPPRSIDILSVDNIALRIAAGYTRLCRRAGRKAVD